MHKNNRRHRHLLLLPLALALLVVSMRQGITLSSSLLAEPVIERNANQAVVNSLWLQQEDGSEILTTAEKRVSVRHGAVIAASRGLDTVLLGSYEVVFFAGAVYVSRYDDAVSVATITAPALIRTAETQFVLPVGYHWQSKDGLPESVFQPGWTLAEPLGASFRRRQLEQLPASLPEPFLPDLTVDGEPSPLAAAIVFPASESREEKAADRSVLVDFLAAVQSGDTTLATTLLQSPAVAAAIARDPLLQQYFFSWFYDVDASTGIRLPLLDVLTRLNDDLWLLAGIHPNTAPLAWALPVHLQPFEQRTLAILTLPAADMQPHGFGEMTTRRWADEWQRWQSSQPIAVRDWHRILTAFVPLLQKMSAEGLPERYQWYETALADALRPQWSYLPQETRAVWQSRSDAGTASSSSQSNRRRTNGNRTAIYDADTAVAMAEEYLARAAALRTTLTVLRPIGGSEVRVEQVAFPTPSGDKLMTFTLDVETGRVSAVFDGQIVQSYSLSFEAFVRWLQRP